MPKRTPINDLDLQHWREYDDILTTSLWLFSERDKSGAHEGWYWGNFVPQVPRQLMWRYTCQHDWVLDAFAGSGTTLIEARRQGRHCLGLELNATIAEQARPAIAAEPNPHNVSTPLVTGDSTTCDFATLLRAHDCAQVQLVVLHPPYHDILRFSASPQDLSNAPSLEVFLAQLSQVITRTAAVLEENRYMALVIGDAYRNGRWLPLGFYTMLVAMTHGFTLKSTIVKNQTETRGKRRQKSLWRWRALANGLYEFGHEYIFILQKTGRPLPERTLLLELLQSTAET